MEFIQGIFAGLMYSVLSITSMILVARYVLMKGFGHGVAAGFGAFIPQIIFAAIATICLTVLHLNAGVFNSFTMSNHVIAFLSFVLLVYVAYKIYKSPMPESHELEAMKKSGTFLKIFAVSIGRPLRIVGYIVLLAIFVAPLGELTKTQSVMLLAGILASLLVWWILFIAIVYAFRKKATPAGVYKFSKIGALVIFLVAVLALIKM